MEEKKDYKYLKKIYNVNKADLKKLKYVYFPLITEPEIALQGVASDFFQLTAINILSRDLPSDYRIIVKEHLLSIGRRPNQFYDQITSLKNVLIADPLDLGLEYIKNAKLIACITGTAGWEAAAMGVPVLSFFKI